MEYQPNGQMYAQGQYGPPPGMDGPSPMMQRQPNIERRPSMDTRQFTNMDRQPPNMDTRQPNMDIRQPNMEIRQPNMEIRQPNMDIRQPNMDIRQVNSAMAGGPVSAGGYPTGLGVSIRPPGNGPPISAPMDSYQRGANERWFGPQRGPMEAPGRGEVKGEGEGRAMVPGPVQDWGRDAEEARRRMQVEANERVRGHERRVALYSLIRNQTQANSEMKDRTEILLQRRNQFTQQYALLSSQLNELRARAANEDPNPNLVNRSKPVPSWLWSLVRLYAVGSGAPPPPVVSQPPMPAEVAAPVKKEPVENHVPKSQPIMQQQQPTWGGPIDGSQNKQVTVPSYKEDTQPIQGESAKHHHEENSEAPSPTVKKQKLESTPKLDTYSKIDYGQKIEAEPSLPNPQVVVGVVPPREEDQSDDGDVDEDMANELDQMIAQSNESNGSEGEEEEEEIENMKETKEPTTVAVEEVSKPKDVAVHETPSPTSKESSTFPRSPNVQSPAEIVPSAPSRDATITHQPEPVESIQSQAAQAPSVPIPEPQAQPLPGPVNTPSQSLEEDSDDDSD
eukprot:Ihof_evm3s133 gene=Ihof_evmTU3s133